MADELMEEIGLFVFRPNQAAAIVRNLGFHVEGNRILAQQGVRARFFCCDDEATVSHLGRVMPGSLRLICDDPSCFHKYAASLVGH